MKTQAVAPLVPSGLCVTRSEIGAEILRIFAKCSLKLMRLLMRLTAPSSAGLGNRTSRLADVLVAFLPLLNSKEGKNRFCLPVPNFLSCLSFLPQSRLKQELYLYINSWVSNMICFANMITCSSWYGHGQRLVFAADELITVSNAYICETHNTCGMFCKTELGGWGMQNTTVYVLCITWPYLTPK
jgi:hypothetical protein